MEAVRGCFVGRISERAWSGLDGVGGMDMDLGAVEHDACFGRGGGGLAGIGMSLSRCPSGPRKGIGGREAGGGVSESGCEIVR